jgi:hypothetical protein
VGFVTLDIPGRGGENGSLDRLDDAVGAMVVGDGDGERWIPLTLRGDNFRSVVDGTNRAGSFCKSRASTSYVSINWTRRWL